MIKKYLSPLFCYIFGHDKYYPHPNRSIWGCARCENGPEERQHRTLWAQIKRQEKAKKDGAL